MAGARGNKMPIGEALFLHTLVNFSQKPLLEILLSLLYRSETGSVSSLLTSLRGLSWDLNVGLCDFRHYVTLSRLLLLLINQSKT